MPAPMLWFYLACSFLATCFIWRSILRRDGNRLVKVLHALFAVLPFFGPMLYIFLIPPPKHALEDQLPPSAKGTTLIPTFAPLVNSLARLFDRKDERP